MPRPNVSAHRSALAVLLLLFACAPQATVQPADETPPAIPIDPTAEILWDNWGVPYIYAKEAYGAVRAFGWAQARAHGDLLLRLYGEARGRAAEYRGEAYVEQDRWIRTQDVPARAQRWLAEQTPQSRALLDAFVEGVNAFAEAHRDSLAEDALRVLPVEPADVLAHVQRVLYFEFLASPRGIEGMERSWQATGTARDPEPQGGSNAWAVGPRRSESGKALLLANPHLPWNGPYTWFEAHLNGGGLDVHGAALVGFPLPGIAFNRRVGWTHTVNPIDAVDLYELTLTADGYRWDGGQRPFDVREETLRIRRDDGSFAEERLAVRSSVHGPVVAEKANGTALALRVAGLDNAQILEQTWRMLTATTMQEFEAATAMLQIPLFNIIAADAGGRILYVFGGAVPVRGRGDWATWQGIIPGDTSAWLWTSLHRYEELPRLADPGSGFVQNANEPPWTATIPIVLDPASYPAYMAPPPMMSLRAGNSARMVGEDYSITFDELIAYKHSTRETAADHLLDDVLLAVRANGNDLARRAGAVLQAWDRTTDPQSRGAVLFEAFFEELMRATNGRPFAVPWTRTSPLSTPDGVADPAAALLALTTAASRVQSQYGVLDVPWGAVHRLRAPGYDLPANGSNGAFGTFRVTAFTDVAGVPTAVGGDSFIAAVEFGDSVRARTLLSYGNWSHPPHRGDQLGLYAAKRLRPVLWDRFDVEENLEFTERF